MKFEHFFGTDICNSADEIEEILCKQNENKVNEFWISNETAFPFMGVLTNSSYAYVHFFDEEGSPGFRGLADEDLGLDEDELPTFYSSNGEIMSVEIECIVSLNKAVEVVREFFETGSMPTSIEWDEL